MDSGKDWLKKDVSSIPALRAGSKEAPKRDTSLSVSSKIRAIETKLKMMSELPQEEFHVSTKPCSSGGVQPVVRTSSNTRTDSSRSSPRSYRHPSSGRFRPYNRR
ncbi:Hypothetical protein NTJ_01971 [Nesidiocoris tenuis]|nr:Hypothetical protein NTJ_01971 [Nesidiocoris tenuis]